MEAGGEAEGKACDMREKHQRKIFKVDRCQFKKMGLTTGVFFAIIGIKQGKLLFLGTFGINLHF